VEVVPHASAKKTARPVENQERSTSGAAGEDAAAMESAATCVGVAKIAKAAIQLSYVACGSGVSTGESLAGKKDATEANIGAAAGPSSATAHNILFIVINAAVRIPVQLLAQSKLRTSGNDEPQRA